MATKRKPRQTIIARLPTLPPLPRLGFTRRPEGPVALRPLTGPATVYDENTVPPMPGGLVATLPEWRVWYWLDKHHIEFDFQSSQMGGRRELGGLVIDFLLPTMVPPMALQVQGEYWHYSTGEQRMHDQQSKAQLEARGYQVIMVDESDVNERLDYILRLAMQGIDLSRMVWS